MIKWSFAVKTKDNQRKGVLSAVGPTLLETEALYEFRRREDVGHKKSEKQ